VNDTFVKILDEVNALQREIPRSGEVPWFRGHGSASWRLKSSLHRFIEDVFARAGKALPPSDMREALRSEFQTLYHTFKHDAWPLLKPDERGEWSIIFQMQHNGIPTLLLDWSESFVCALFFAFQSWQPPDNAAIFVLDPGALNLQTAGTNSQVTLDDSMAENVRIKTNQWHPLFVAPEHDRPTLAVTPVRSSRRMLAQRSTFTLSGDSFDSLDSQYGSIIRKIVLPATIYDDVESFLELVNIGIYGYFPDLEGLQQQYRARYQWHMREAERFKRSQNAG
jgi:hypothetical protein